MVLIKNCTLFAIKMNSQQPLPVPCTELTIALSNVEISNVFENGLIIDNGNVVLSRKKEGIYPQLYWHPDFIHGFFRMPDADETSEFFVLNIKMKNLVGKIPNFNPQNVEDVLKMLKMLEEEPMCDIKGCSIPVGKILGIGGNLCRFHATMQPVCCFGACMNKVSNEGSSCESADCFSARNGIDYV
jgi:hypothetical protein